MQRSSLLVPYDKISSTLQPTLQPDEEMWIVQTRIVGYPRPQGNLSNFSWGLQPQAQRYYNNLYANILK